MSSFTSKVRRIFDKNRAQNTSPSLVETKTSIEKFLLSLLHQLAVSMENGLISYMVESQIGESTYFSICYYSGPEGTRVKVPPLFFVITRGRTAPSQGPASVFCYYSGPEGGRVKVPPLFFVITRGRKAPESRFRLCVLLLLGAGRRPSQGSACVFCYYSGPGGAESRSRLCLLLLLGAGRRPSQGFASVFCYYSGPEGARFKVPPVFFVITRGRKAPESRFRLCFLLLLGVGRRPSQGFACVFCYYSGPEGARVKVPPVFFVITRGRKAAESRSRLCLLLLLVAGRRPSQGSACVFCYYFGPEGARVKVSPLFFVITRGWKAPESRFRLCVLLLLGAGRRPSQGSACVFCYYSGPEGARVKVSPLFFVITRGRKAPESRFRLCFLLLLGAGRRPSQGSACVFCYYSGPEGGRVKVPPLSFVITRGRKAAESRFRLCFLLLLGAGRRRVKVPPLSFVITRGRTAPESRFRLCFLLLLGAGRHPSQGSACVFCYYSGPEGGRVKVPPLFFVITRGRKAPESRFRLCVLLLLGAGRRPSQGSACVFCYYSGPDGAESRSRLCLLLLLGAGRRPSQGFACVFCYYSGPEGTRVKVPPVFFVITRGRKAAESRSRLCFLLLLGAGRRPSQGPACVFCYYSGPEGARFKVPPLFFVITRGRKAPESRFRLCFLLLLGVGRRPSQGFASVFCYYSGPEGARVKVPPVFFVITRGRKAPSQGSASVFCYYSGPEGGRVKVPPLFLLLLGVGRRPSQGFASVFCYYLGPEGARVKVSPLFFVITRGRKAPSQGSACVFCYYSESEGARVKVSPLSFVITRGRKEPSQGFGSVFCSYSWCSEFAARLHSLNSVTKPKQMIFCFGRC